MLFEWHHYFVSRVLPGGIRLIFFLPLLAQNLCPVCDWAKRDQCPSILYLPCLGWVFHSIEWRLCGWRESTTSWPYLLVTEPLWHGVEWDGKCWHSAPPTGSWWEREPFLFGHTYSEWNLSHIEQGVVEWRKKTDDSSSTTDCSFQGLRDILKC